MEHEPLSRYAVPLSVLEASHVAPADQVEGHAPVPPPPWRVPDLVNGGGGAAVDADGD